MGKAKAKKKKQDKRDCVKLTVDLKGKMPKLDYFTDVSAISKLPLADVRKIQEGLFLTVKRRLREKKKCRIPNIVQLRMRELPVRAAFTKKSFGKEIQVKAREKPVRKVTVYVLSHLKKAVA